MLFLWLAAVPVMPNPLGAYMLINRKWAMPSSDTFDVPPIGEFVKSYLRQSKVSVDPFARNKRWATYTNDLNPDTAAEYHLDALEFLEMLRDTGTIADLVIFDPPYSARHVVPVLAGAHRTHAPHPHYAGSTNRDVDFRDNRRQANAVYSAPSPVQDDQGGASMNDNSGGFSMTLEEVVNHFLETHRPECQQPGDITVKMAEKTWGVKSEKATAMLNALTQGDDPALIRVDGVILDNHKVGTVWRIISKSPAG